MVNLEFLRISAFTVPALIMRIVFQLTAGIIPVIPLTPELKCTPSFSKVPVKKSAAACLKHLCPSTGIIRICLLDYC